MRTIDDPSRARRLAALAILVALTASGCNLNPQTEDPGAHPQTSADLGAGGSTSAGGARSAGGVPNYNPPPQGFGGMNSGSSADAGPSAGGFGPIVTPQDGSADSASHVLPDARPDSGDARPDARSNPTRD